MEFEWDEDKRRLNLSKHGLDFLDAQELFSGPMLVRPDHRHEYGEPRFIGYGTIQGRVVAVAFTTRGKKIRIISLRKGNSREQERFAQEIADRLGQS